ncbi:hypothetical protein M430DRAFT_187230 [Amorphotheca resinae ATCC 22711]|uniref:Uncharacterized protein n=1 Tax=Amorphotheca resinae ATCC 22711 TaxID=857342 RepID=A0A2T3AQP8_AMORE|nr:hypothetical protein M430DRAFT_187230 [Amorphotheca resinae ATCC 22711]PSS08595.1 hypothetical protein M430DRAFT_187230 [Amorphotheca resinae ATCC 22711]
MASPQPTEEDYNLPSEERRALLQRFQEALGDVPPHFWAACQLCDMKSLEALVKSAECCPDLLGLVIGQTGKEMIAYWNQSALASSRTTTPQTSPRFGASGLSSTGSVSSLGGPYGNSPPPAKRRKTSIDRSELEREKVSLEFLISLLTRASTWLVFLRLA